MSTAVLNGDEILTKIQSRRNQFLDSLPKIGAGNSIEFSDAVSHNDRIWQGDLGIAYVENTVPEGYVQVDLKQEGDKCRQLVPGNTEGSKHVLRSLDGVKMWRPKDWNDLSLNGPYIQLTKPNVIEHPTHGPVLLKSGCSYETGYQVNLDLESKIEARARD